MPRVFCGIYLIIVKNFLSIDIDHHGVQYYLPGEITYLRFHYIKIDFSSGSKIAYRKGLLREETKLTTTYFQSV